MASIPSTLWELFSYMTDIDIAETNHEGVTLTGGVLYETVKHYCILASFLMLETFVYWL